VLFIGIKIRVRKKNVFVRRVSDMMVDFFNSGAKMSNLVLS
jgi:hypothetical protein